MKNIYAALLLHNLGKEVDVENIKKVIAATGAEFDESQVKSLVASLKGVDIAKELESASLFAAAPVSEAPKAEKKEEKPKEEKKEAAAEGLSALFG